MCIGEVGTLQNEHSIERNPSENTFTNLKEKSQCHQITESYRIANRETIVTVFKFLYRKVVTQRSRPAESLFNCIQSLRLSVCAIGSYAIDMNI